MSIFDGDELNEIMYEKYRKESSYFSTVLERLKYLEKEHPSWSYQALWNKSQEIVNEALDKWVAGIW